MTMCIPPSTRGFWQRKGFPKDRFQASPLSRWLRTKCVSSITKLTTWHMRYHIILWRKLGSSTYVFCFIIDQSDDYDVKRIVKKNPHPISQSPKVTPSNCFFCPTSRPKPKDVRRCCLKSDWNNQSIIKTVGSSFSFDHWMDKLWQL